MYNAARVYLLLSCLVLVTYGIRTTRRAADTVVHANQEHPPMEDVEYARAQDAYKALDHIPERMHKMHRHEMEPEYTPEDEKVAPEIVRNDEVESEYLQHEYVDNMNVQVGPPPRPPTEVVGTVTVAEEVPRLPEESFAETKATSTQTPAAVAPAPAPAPAPPVPIAAVPPPPPPSPLAAMVVPAKVPPPGIELQPAYHPAMIPPPYVPDPQDSDEAAAPHIEAELTEDDYDSDVEATPVILKGHRHRWGNTHDHVIRPWHPHHQYVKPVMIPPNETLPTPNPPDTIPNPWQTLHEIHHIKREANKIQQAEVLQALKHLHEDAEKLRDEVEDNEEKLHELRERAKRMSDACRDHRHRHRFAEIDPVLAEIMNNVDQAEQAALGASVLHAQFKATMRAVVSELAALEAQVSALPVPEESPAAAPVSQQ